MILNIDWTEHNLELDEVLKSENIDFTSPETIIQSLLLEHNLNATQAGTILVAAKERGLIENEVWPEHYKVMKRGSQSTMHMNIMKSRIKKELINGTKIKINPVIGKDKQIEDTDTPYIKSDTKEGIERARQYILNQVTAHIRSRLAIIVNGGGDVKGIVRELKKEIDKIMKEFV